MRKIFFFIIGFSLLFCSASFAEDMKIGIINLQKIIQDSNAGKRMSTSLEAKFKGKKAELEKLQNELKALKDNLDKQSAVLSLEAKKGKIEEFSKKYQEFQKKVQDHDKTVMEEQQKLLEPIGKKLQEVTHAYAKKNGYAAILNGAHGIVVYASPQVDLTKIILEEFNKAAK